MTTRFKFFFCLFGVIGLPMLPLIVLMLPFAKWITISANQPQPKLRCMYKQMYTTGLGWMEMLSLSTAFTLYALLMFLPFTCGHTGK